VLSFLTLRSSWPEFYFVFFSPNFLFFFICWGVGNDVYTQTLEIVSSPYRRARNISVLMDSIFLVWSLLMTGSLRDVSHGVFSFWERETRWPLLVIGKMNRWWTRNNNNKKRKILLREYPPANTNSQRGEKNRN
jgi:hypothetical protein